MNGHDLIARLHGMTDRERDMPILIGTVVAISIANPAGDVPTGDVPVKMQIVRPATDFIEVIRKDGTHARVMTA